MASLLFLSLGEGGLAVGHAGRISIILAPNED